MKPHIYGIQNNTCCIMIVGGHYRPSRQCGQQHITALQLILETLEWYFYRFPDFLWIFFFRPFDPQYYEDEFEDEEMLDEEGRTRLKLKVCVCVDEHTYSSLWRWNVFFACLYILMHTVLFLVTGGKYNSVASQKGRGGKWNAREQRTYCQMVWWQVCVVSVTS